MKLPEGKTIAMPRSLLSQWLHALDIEMYPKAGGAMKNERGYCCLGVLQMVACGEVEPIDKEELLQGPSIDSNYAGYPSVDWKEKYNVTFIGAHDLLSPAPGVPLTHDEYTTIADLNDEREWESAKHGDLPYRYTFPQIADFIRTHAVALEDLEDAS